MALPRPPWDILKLQAEQTANAAKMDRLFSRLKRTLNALDKLRHRQKRIERQVDKAAEAAFVEDVLREPVAPPVPQAIDQPERTPAEIADDNAGQVAAALIPLTDRDAEEAILIAAADVKELRAKHVHTVLDCCTPELREFTAVYVIAHRPDLAHVVTDALARLRREKP